jgi:hypothetical protein
MNDSAPSSRLVDDFAPGGWITIPILIAAVWHVSAVTTGTRLRPSFRDCRTGSRVQSGAEKSGCLVDNFGQTVRLPAVRRAAKTCPVHSSGGRAVAKRITGIAMPAAAPLSLFLRAKHARPASFTVSQISPLRTCWHCSLTARASRQVLGEGDHQASAHGGDRIWNVAFGRNGGAAGSVTGGNGKFFERPGGTRS